MSSSLQATITRHWDDRARSYLHNHQKVFGNPATAQTWKQLLSDWIGPAQNLKVLDAGCGPGTLTRPLAELGHQVTAVDVSAQMLQRARQNLAGQEKRVEFIRSDASELDLEPDSYDLVVSRYVVWTLPEPAKAIDQWYRLLKPGGRLGIIDGNWYYGYYRSRTIRAWSNLTQMLYRLSNRGDPSQKLATAYAPQVPATHVLRPDWDLGLLAGRGFVDLKVTRGVGPLVKGISLQRFSTLFSRPFLVEGRKP